jgi:hypothetical protein
MNKVHLLMAAALLLLASSCGEKKESLRKPAER